MQEYIALGVFAVVYTLIIGRRRFGVQAAFMSVNLDVIAFLFGMFSIVSALDRAGVLQRVAIRMLRFRS